MNCLLFVCLDVLELEPWKLWKSSPWGRVIDSKKGPAVTKGGGEGARRVLRGIMISTHNVGGPRGRQYSTEKTSGDSSASYYTDGQ